MATLTYDPTETPEGEFTAEEQESLAVGEELAAQQEELLAGKFRDAEDLEQAYLELQKKLGDPEARQQPQETEEVNEEVEEEEVEQSDFLDRLWNESQDEYTEETLQELRAMSPEDIAQMYLDFRSNQAEPEASEITDQDATTIRESVGGEQAYGNMMLWAKDNLSDNEIQMYDEVMNLGNPLAAYFAAQALKYRYNDAVGVEGELLTGKPARNEGQAFRSQAELVRAMSDPRYDNDPAYRADIAAKLERSNLDF